MLIDYHIEQAMREGSLLVEPYDRKNLGPASYDLTLDKLFRRPTWGVEDLDVADLQPGHTTLVENSVDHEGNDVIVLNPGDFLLGTTVEVVRLGRNVAARVEGRSSVGRLGLLVHTTAGFIDPGFEGQITLELYNCSPWTIALRPGMRIAQLAFTRCSGPAERPYGARGHYQGQEGPVESRLTL